MQTEYSKIDLHNKENEVDAFNARQVQYHILMT